jgi:hypothetical protein
MPVSTLGLTKPTVGGSTNNWGTILNAALDIINLLGGIDVINVNTAYVATKPVFPEMIIRVTTAGLNIPITLPNPSLVAGKIYTVLKVDSGLGNVQILGPINNLTEWDLDNQFTYVRLYANGSSYDMIGGS